MSHITYYNTRKTYTPLALCLPELVCNLELLRFENKLAFLIDAKVAKDIRNPMLLICGKKAMVRTNRYTFFNITVKDDLWPLLRNYDTVEMLVNSDDSSYETVYVKIQRVLHFPDTLKLEEWTHDASTASDDDDD